MKQVRNIFSAILATVLGVTSCTPDFDAPKPNDQQLPEATYTISGLKKAFMTPGHLISNNADNSKYKDVFSVYNMDTTGVVTINGIVISSDAGGNTYKKLVIRDPKDGSCIDISVDVSGISAFYPVGQAVQVTCNKLQIGLYADMPVIGSTYFNDASNRLRYEPGRMSWPVAKTNIIAYGMPDQKNAQPVLKTIPEIKAGAPAIYSQLVKIDYVEFGYFVQGSTPNLFPTNKFISMNDPAADPNVTFSEKNDLNVPVSRGIRDSKGNIIPVTTSSYAKFASDKLPKGAFDLTAIVAWYKDKSDSDGNFQMSVQDRSAIVKVSDSFEGSGSGGGETTGQGTEANPYTVADAIAKQGETAKWVDGYIIGAINTTNSENFVWEYQAPFGTASNLLIAATPDERDQKNILVVQLPVGAIRDALNLVSNSTTVLGKKVKLQGDLTAYFGKPGLKNPTSYDLDGQTPPPPAQGIFEESFATGQGAFTTQSFLGDQSWTYDAKQKYMKISGYVSGVNHANDDLLISPAIDFTGVTAATISFDHTINKGAVANMKTNHTLQFSADNGTTWESVTIANYPVGTTWDFVNSGDIVIPAKFLNKAGIKFAFKYLCSEKESATWEVKNIIVK